MNFLLGVAPILMYPETQHLVLVQYSMSFAKAKLDILFNTHELLIIFAYNVDLTFYSNLCLRRLVSERLLAEAVGKTHSWKTLSCYLFCFHHGGIFSEIIANQIKF